MLRVLEQIAEVTAPTRDQPLVLDADAVEMLRTVRLHYVVQKLRTRRVRHLLAEQLAAAGVAADGLESNFTNGSPLMTGRVCLPDTSELGFQLQSGQWRGFVIVPQQHQGTGQQGRKLREAYTYGQLPAVVHLCGRAGLRGPFDGAPGAAYKHFVPGFIYDYVKVPGLSVPTCLAMAEVVLREAATYRNAWTPQQA